MQEIFNQIYHFILEEIKNNDFASGAFIASIGLGLWQSLKALLPLAWQRIRRYINSSVTIEEKDPLYNIVSQFISEKYPKKLKIIEAFINEQYQGSNIPEEGTLGYSDIKYRHLSDWIIVRYKNRFIKISKEREKLENATDFRTAFMGRIVISSFFGKKTIRRFLEEANKNTSKKTKKYIRTDWTWEAMKKENQKRIDQIFFDQKYEILSQINQWSKQQAIYKKRGIVWKYALLLEGPGGFGKTVFANAIAEYTGRNSYIINLGNTGDSNFIDAFNHIGKNSLLILDDFDIGATKRDENKETLNEHRDSVSLSTLLSCFDGNLSRGDLIIIATTNFISKIDKAMIRKGRFDQIYTFNTTSLDSAKKMIAHYYECNPDKIEFKNYKPSIPTVDIQNALLSTNSLEDAIKVINHQNYLI